MEGRLHMYIRKQTINHLMDHLSMNAIMAKIMKHNWISVRFVGSTIMGRSGEAVAIMVRFLPQWSYLHALESV